ncbi:MAG: PadR family transcriptional regulator [Solirubrobacterales bacterium]
MPKKINLTVPSYVVLGMVEGAGEATPYDMKRLAAISLDHFRSVRHAQLYSEPDRLAEAGLLSVRREQSGRRRKLYSLTAAGSDALEAWRHETDEPLAEIRDEGLLKIFFGADPTVVAERQIELHGGRLKEFEDSLETYGPFMTEGQLLVLRMGIEQEIHWIATLKDIASGKLHGRKSG